MLAVLSDVAHMKMREKVSAAFCFLFAFGLEQYIFPKDYICKASKSCGRKAWKGMVLLGLASHNDACLALCFELWVPW